MNRLNQETREGIVHSLVECASQRSCERRYNVSNKTVAKLANDVGEMAISHIAQTRGLRVRQIQADELWSFVKVKQKNVARQKVQEVGAGTVWTYLAICSDTKFIVGYRLGDRKLADARAFYQSIRDKLEVDENGEFTQRLEILTDGLMAYDEAGEIVFGDDADRAMLIKQYSQTNDAGEPTPASRYQGAERRVIAGDIEEKSITTHAIERFNLTLRMFNKRFTRKSNAFSKKLRNHERALALTIIYYNYCWLPYPQTRICRETGEVLQEKRAIPAMEMGLTDRVWEISDLLELTDAYLADVKASERSVSTDLVAGPDVDKGPEAFWVYSSEQHNFAKVHKAECGNCNHGTGRGGGGAKYGKWHGCETLEEATTLAEHLQPHDNSICKICLGSYRTSGYRGPRANRSSGSPRRLLK